MKKQITIGEIQKGDIIVEHERGGYRFCRCKALCDAYIINEPNQQGWEVKLKYIDGDHPDMDKGGIVTMFSNPEYPAYAPILYREITEKPAPKTKGKK